MNPTQHLLANEEISCYRKVLSAKLTISVTVHQTSSALTESQNCDSWESFLLFSLGGGDNFR